MTDPKALADALVEAGIAIKDKPPTFDDWEQSYALPDWHTSQPLSEFITDWRVAGKVLESMGSKWMDVAIGSGVKVFDSDIEGPTRLLVEIVGSTDPLPRAVIEAWYEARQ